MPSVNMSNIVHHTLARFAVIIIDILYGLHALAHLFLKFAAWFKFMRF
jgi:hypothetical protein